MSAATPRSDGQRMSHQRYVGYVANESGPVIPLEFARDLERELDSETKYHERVRVIEAENARLRRIAELASDAVEAGAIDECYLLLLRDAINM